MCAIDRLFTNCHFIGGSANYCRRFGDSLWENLTADDEGYAFVNRERVAAGKKRYSIDDLHTDVRSLINKFVDKGGIGLRTVRKGNLGTGAIGVSPHGTEITEAIIKVLCEHHHISGISDKGLNIRPAAVECVKFFAANNVFTGPLSEVVNVLEKKLCLKP